MIFYPLAAVLYVGVYLATTAVAIYLLVLVIKALRKYIASKEVREEKREIRKSLGEELRENRLRCKMTQEFVADALGVSRQAVSKWENGTTDPSTSNLLTLAGLYAVSGVFFASYPPGWRWKRRCRRAPPPAGPTCCAAPSGPPRGPRPPPGWTAPKAPAPTGA